MRLLLVLGDAVVGGVFEADQLAEEGVVAGIGIARGEGEKTVELQFVISREVAILTLQEAAGTKAGGGDGNGRGFHRGAA